MKLFLTNVCELKKCWNKKTIDESQKEKKKTPPIPVDASAHRAFCSHIYLVHKQIVLKFWIRHHCMGICVLICKHLISLLIGTDWNLFVAACAIFNIRTNTDYLIGTVQCSTNNARSVTA